MRRSRTERKWSGRSKSKTCERTDLSGEPTFDLLNAPVAGTFLRWRHSRTLVRMILLIVALAMIAHGFFGPSLAPKNLATTLGWVHFRGALILILLCAGNFFC